MLPTPSQTVGPFYGYALPFPDGGAVVPAGHPDAVTVHGHVLDGAGEPIPDALLEFWQPAPDGSRRGAPGSLRRDHTTGGYAGRDGHTFTGFARVAADADGSYTLHTLRPGDVPYLSVCVFARGLLHHLFTRVYLPAPGAGSGPADGRVTEAPAGPAAGGGPVADAPAGLAVNGGPTTAAVAGTAVESAAGLAAGRVLDGGFDEDPLLAALAPERRATLVAEPTGPRAYRFDIHLQGEKETVFLELR